MSTPSRFSSQVGHPPTLVSVIRDRVRERPGAQAFSFLVDGEREGDRVTFQEIDRRARAVAFELERQGVGEGERALLLVLPGLDFVWAFLGCLYAGVVAVPLHPPRLGGRAGERVASIVRDARPAAALTTPGTLGRFRAAVPDAAGLRWIAIDGVAARDDLSRGLPRRDDVAFLQYTSGSTADPKGVVVRHGELVHNQRMIRAAFGLEPDSVVVSWLPLYHDMGLIGGVLAPLFTGCRCVLMAPGAFIRKPRRWLAAIGRYGATVSGGPDFAYRLCTERIPERERAGLRLDTWRVAFNGSEPVRASTLAAFSRAFASAGFRERSVYPCYGLAEGTLFVSGGSRGRGPRVAAFEAEALGRGAAVVPGPTDRATELVSCGTPWLGQEIAIVDPDTRRCLDPGEVGEVWVRGASVARGYWRRPEATEEFFRAWTADGRGPFLRTGDLGLLWDGDLFLCGRRKDLVILRGRNHYPQDLELTAEHSHAAVRSNGVAAFSVEAAAGERLVLVVEVERGKLKRAPEIADTVRAAVAAAHEAAVWDLMVVPPGGVPRTTSGKVRRGRCRELYLENALPVSTGHRAGARVRSAGPVAPAGRPARAGSSQAEVPAGVRAVVVEALGVEAEHLPADRPLTACGLDSLGAAQVSGGLERDFGAVVPPGDLLDGATLAELADRVERGGCGPAADPAGEAGAGEKSDLLPLTHGQEALWYLDRADPAGGAYTIAVVARVLSGLDPGALVRAVHGLAARHEALRLAVGETRDGLRQRIGSEPRVDCAIFDLTGPGAVDRELSLMTADAYRRFDLERGPLFRLRLYRRHRGWGLLLAAHHLAADLGSFQVLARELAVLYRQERRAGTAPLPPPPPFAPWARSERLRAEADGEAAAFWRRAVPTEPPTLDLPTDRPRPATQSFRGTAALAHLEPGATRRLRRLARRWRTTPSAVVLAAFQAFLHRLSGQEGFAVGVPTAGRDRREVADLVGYLVNPVVVASEPAGGASFGSHLGRVRDRLVAAVRHRGHPFPLLARRLRPERDPARNPVFQALFAAQQARDAGLGAFALGSPEARLDLGGLALTPLRLPEARVQVDVQLATAELGAGAGRSLALELRLDAALFDATTGRRWLDAFGVLVRVATATPEAAVEDLPLLAPGERAAVVSEWPQGSGATPSPSAIPEAFARCVAEHPDRPAVVAGGGVVTYGELDRRVSGLAARLRAAGVGPEIRVAVGLERTPVLVESLLAVLAAGGAYVPLDPAWPAARRRLVSTDSGATVFVGPGEGTGVGSVVIRSSTHPLAPPAPSGPQTSAAGGEDWPEALAYVIYTSGSTGTPKGVGISRRNAAALVAWARRAFAPSELDRVLAGTSIGFDLSAFELFATLTAGGTVILAGSALDLADPDGSAARSRPTLLNTVPSALRELVRLGGLPQSAVAVNLAGEPLDRELARAVHRELPGIRLSNLYAPSETTTYSTHAAVAADGRPPTIGRPLPGERAFVVDPALRPVPTGVAGELLLGGDGVCRGYLGRPAWTAERFVPDPFAAPERAPGARLYRTGDLARWLPGGEIRFVGRRDGQVKVRGVRVELGEVESALASHPAVSEAVVTVAPAGGLRALWIAAPGGRAGAEALAAFLRERLPAAMVPGAFLEVPELPRTATGKIDRRRATSLGAARAGAPEAAVPPRTPAEEIVADLFREVLELPPEAPVDIRDDLFRQGGHSLLLARLVARLRDVFGVEIALREALVRPTVAGLAAAAAGPAAAEPFPRADPVAPPLSFAQESLWAAERLAPGSAWYNMPAGLRLKGPVRLAALATALRALVARHAPLRAVFEERDGTPCQRIAPAAAVRLPVVDLGALPEGAAARARRSLGRQEAARSFGLGSPGAGWPLLRCLAVRTSPRDHLLVLVVHHLAGDGWSLRVVVPREIETAYASALEDRLESLPRPPVSYGDFALWQRRRLTGDRLDGLLRFWRERLDGLDPLELPGDRPRPVRPRHLAGARRIAVGPVLARRLTRLARDRSTTFFPVVLAAYQALLGRLAGTRDVAVGVPHARRDRSELEGLVGLFVNTLLLRTEQPPSAPFAKHLDGVHRAALDAYAHAELPFERLVAALFPDRESRSRSPIQAFVAFDATAARPPGFPGVTAELEDLSSGTAKFDLSLFLEPAGEGWTGALVYDAELFDPTTVERWARRLVASLEVIAETPEVRLGDLPGLGRGERFQVLREWAQAPRRATGRAAASEAVHLRVARHVARSPDAPAVLAAGTVLSFGALGRRVRGVASLLAAAGVGPGATVAVHAEPGPDLAAAVTGVLWAGGAFLPLDPRDPPDRIAALLGDARPAALLARPEAALEPPSGVARLPLGSGGDEPGPVAAPEATPVPSGALAYVLYTSGSSGRPKGVMVSHGALSRYLAWAEEELLRGAPVPLLSRSSFDASLKQLLLPLAEGRPVVVPESGLDRPAALAETLARLPGGAINCVPAAWDAFVAAVEQGDAPLPAGLSRVLLGGDDLAEPLVERTRRLLPAAEVVNLYGPTEATANAAAGRVWSGAPVSLGNPVAGARLLVLDPRCRPAPLGVDGEIAIGGPGLARGYLGLPAATAERFVPDPWSGCPGGRLYRTGDLARRLADGTLRFRGRFDRQVQVRGHRVELDEVEAALRACPGVEAGAVVLVAAVGGGGYLAAYVEPASVEADGVRAALERSLPRWMVPAVVVPLARLPRLASGKLDRRRLPTPTETAPPTSSPAALPEDPVAEIAARVWGEVLGLDRPVRRHDEFFALGGHSLAGGRVMARLATALGTDLPVRTLFETPRFDRFVAAVRNDRGVPAPPPVARRFPPRGDAPASYAQDRLWFLDKLVPGSPLYNVPAAARLTGPASVRHLAAALERVARRHETLRTSLVERAGEPVQRVADEPGLVPLLVDLSSLPPGRAAAAASRVADLEARTPFDLSRPPLARAVLVRRASENHDLLLTLHHAVVDGWSLAVLLDELGASYGGEPRPLPDLPVQYADFAVWQRRWFATEALQDQVAFWRERLAGLPPLDLAGQPRTAAATHRGGTVPVVLPPRLVVTCRRAAHELGATTFMVLLAAFQALLGRMSGQDAFGVATAAANRPRPELEGLVGLFVNTVVLPADLSGDPSFRELVGRARAAALEGYDHQDVPFERLVEVLEPERDLSRPPLAQVMLAVHNAPPPVPRLAGLDVTPFERHSGTAKLDLALALRDRPSGISGTLEYAADRFEATFARRLASSFLVLLEAALGDAAGGPGLDVVLASLPLLAPAERHQLLTEWSGAGLPHRSPGAGRLDREATIGSRIRARAALTPDRVAVATAEECLTYRELGRRSAALAVRLRNLGVRPETRVAVAGARRPSLVVALLGVLEAGAAYVPLDPDYPPERLSFILEDAGCAAILADDATANRLPLRSAGGEEGEGAPLLRLDDLAAGRTSADPGRPADGGGSGGHLAYLIYTSGSTGRPKGVALEHRGAAALLDWIAEAWPRPALRAVLASTSICFDFSIFEIFGTLAAGGTVLLARDALEVPNLATASRASFLTAVPSVLSEMLRQAHVPEGVTTIALGGEPLPAALVDRLEPADRGLRIENLYGPSEITTYATSAPVHHGTERAAGRPPIGRPIAGARVFVVDRALELSPAGSAGELVLGGAGLARGYLGRPALTAERFVPDPFARHDGAGGRLYRTGDRVRFTPAGELDFLGRNDDQVKVHGVRIEPGEVEQALLAHGDVVEAAVALQGRPGADTRLVAYVVARDRDLGSEALRRDLAARLPGPMVPAAFAFLDRLPRTPSGKIDRRALVEGPAPEGGAPAAGRLPRTPLEAAVADLWADLLDLDRVDVHQDFFSAGGHSLLAARLAEGLRRSFEVDLPLAELFRWTTVAEQAEAIARAVGRGAPAVLPRALEPAERARGVPLSPGQSRLLLLHRLQAPQPVYHVPLGLSISGDLDLPALGAAAAALVRRHEAFRTRFVTTSGGDLQSAAPPWRPPLPVADLSRLPAARRRSAAERAATDWARRPFDLESGRLLAPVLLRVGWEDHRLILAQHHLVSDGWSQTVVVRDLALLYEERLGGEDAGLPDPVLQPGDVAAWQRARLAAGELDAALERWRRRLAGLGPLRLPVDRPRAAELSNRGGSVPWVLAPDLVERLRGVGRKHGATLFTTLLAGLQALLGRLAGNDDVAVGTPVANRDAPGLADAVAFLVDTVVLRADLGGDPSFSRALTRLRGSVLDAFRDHDVPFERVVEAVRPDRNLGRTPLFEVLFAFQELPEPGRRLGAASLALEAVGTGTTQFDLTVSARPEAGAVVGSVEYRRDLFDEVSVRRLARQLETLLAAAAEAPDRPLEDLPLQGRSERHQVAVELGGARADLRGAETLYRRFRRHAERGPDAVALVEGGRSVSYGELRRRAERCAARLRAAGVGPEDVVAVLSERVDLFVAGALGVHAAGAAYLPLDPEHPPERLRTVLADARARVALAHGAVARTLPAGAPPVLALAEAVAGPGGVDRSLPGPHTAYVIYTSGSTGRPKGVVVDQAGLARLFDASRGPLSFLPEDTVSQFHSPAFDFSLWEMWSALSHGARLAVIPGEGRYAADALARFLERERVTVLNQTPSAFSRLLEVEALLDRPVAPDLRLLDLGGEALSPPVLAPWFARRPGRRPRVVNVYGPTEVVVIATCREITDRDVGGSGASVLGHQIADATLRLVDRGGSVVPLGAGGEIWVGGAALARGYLGRPDLTADRFVPDPWSERPGARVYRTGDLARRDHSGELQFLGRVDGQVKIRGHRIEPAEVEAALLDLPGVEQAAVVARPGGVDGALRLVAYLVSSGDAVEGDGAPALRDLLAERLPRYMVPERWVVLDRLPLTSSGKLDRRALPDPPPLRRGSEGRPTEPRSDLEERIAAIWRDVLEIDRVGVHDNFFDLGGHSLLLARAHRELCRALDREVPLVQLFRHPSVAALAASLGDAPDDAAPGAGVQRAARIERAARRRDRMERLRATRRGPGRSRPAGGRERR